MIHDASDGVSDTASTSDVSSDTVIVIASARKKTPGTPSRNASGMNTTTGVIDLNKTLNGPGGLQGLLGGAFGLLPVNGSAFTSTIYYKLNDPSNEALENIQVQFVYYDTKSAVPGGVLGGVVNILNNLLSGNILSTGANPRPPLVIITRRD